jgi:hypothetical protein
VHVDGVCRLWKALWVDRRLVQGVAEGYSSKE